MTKTPATSPATSRPPARRAKGHALAPRGITFWWCKCGAKIASAECSRAVARDIYPVPPT